MDDSIDEGLHKKDDHAAIKPLAIEMPVSIGQGEKSIKRTYNHGQKKPSKHDRRWRSQP